MEIKVYQVDAFANRAFEGNPAAVCPLDDWLPDTVMQSIAAENNLSETAFFVGEGNQFAIRWFTPATEVDLCGHATLASAHVLFECLGMDGDSVAFSSRSGPLYVSKQDDLLVLDFPAQPPAPCTTPDAVTAAFDRDGLESWVAEDLVVIFDDAEAVRTARPDIEALRGLDNRGVIITAAGDDCDFVARFFGPNVGIDEDPVTGSAYTQLVPYWSGRLGKKEFHARQLSNRGGELFCRLAGDRVSIGGRAVLFSEGHIHLDLPG